MIYLAKEGETTWFENLSPSDVPYPLPGGINIYARQNKLGVEAHGVVGAIPLLNGETLQITPKIERVNFLRLLFKAEGIQPDLEREYDDFVSYSVDEEQNIDRLVARQFIISIAEIMKKSPQQGRIKKVRSGQFTEGQVIVAATALNLATHRPDPIIYMIRERTLNIPDNRVLTEALLRAWPLLDEVDRSKYQGISDRWLRRFPRSDDLTSDLEHVKRKFAAGNYGGPRDYYRRPMMLAEIILGSSGLGFSEGTTVQGDAILLNTAHIFEKYLRNVVTNAYSESGYLVTSGTTNASSLYTDGSYELRPDIVISRDGKILLFADAKYKQPGAADHYQMNTYLAVNGIKRGILLAPLYAGSEVLLKEYATSSRTIVYEAYLPMENLDVTEDFLRTLVQKFSQ